MSVVANYHGRRFRPVETTDNGEVGGETVFRYCQDGTVFWATYEGGGVIHGHMAGRVEPDGGLHFRYHHLSMQDGQPPEPVSGLCHSRLEVLPDGRYRLFEDWQWTSGDRSSGTSIVEEIAD